MRTKLSAAYEFTRSVWFSHGKIPALPVLKRLRHPWVCAAVSGCGASSAAFELTRSVRFSHDKSPALPVLIRLSQRVGWRHPWVCAAVSGCGASSPPPMKSRVPCDSAMAIPASPVLKRLSQTVGAASLRMRRKLYEFDVTQPWLSPHRRYSSACLKRFAPPMGLRCSLLRRL